MNRFEDRGPHARREQGELSVERFGELWALTQADMLGDRSRSPRATAPGGRTSRTSSARRATCTPTPTGSCSRCRCTGPTSSRAPTSCRATSSCSRAAARCRPRSSAASSASPFRPPGARGLAPQTCAGAARGGGGRHATPDASDPFRLRAQFPAAVEVGTLRSHVRARHLHAPHELHEAKGARPAGIECRDLRRLPARAHTLAIAWSGYQAASWSGLQAERYTQASAARTLANRHQINADEQRIRDLPQLQPVARGCRHRATPRLSALYERRFRDEFRPAFPRRLDRTGLPLTNPDATDTAAHAAVRARRGGRGRSTRAARRPDSEQGKATENVDEYVFAPCSSPARSCSSRAISALRVGEAAHRDARPRGGVPALGPGAAGHHAHALSPDQASSARNQRRGGQLRTQLMVSRCHAPPRRRPPQRVRGGEVLLLAVLREPKKTRAHPAGWRRCRRGRPSRRRRRTTSWPPG